MCPKYSALLQSQSDQHTNTARSGIGVLTMKLGFISLNVPGHLNRVTALVRQLQARNNTDVTELAASCSDTAVDLFGVRRRPASKFEETAKETEIERRHRKALCSLISLAIPISLLVGTL